MTAQPVAEEPRVDRFPGPMATFATTVRAVLTREVRWRMRGRRAFAVASATVVLLGLIVLGIHEVVLSSAMNEARWQFADPVDGEPAAVVGITATASAIVGQAIFGGLLAVLTILILVIAPALTSGAIASERERQTLELLVTSPVSTLGMLVGKLLGSLAYVLLLLLASVPLMSLVFVFGGVGPDDVLRAYLLLLAIAFGMGALGLLVSALVGRTQVATVVSYLVVFALVAGTVALHTWMYLNSSEDGDARHAPEAILWLNPAVADLDVLCSALAEPGPCSYTVMVTGGPQDEGAVPRDALWPRSALAFLVVGAGLTMLATQFVSPSRRYRARRATRPAAQAP